MNQYYLYLHVCPETDKIVYVGSGVYDRAWCLRKNQRNAAHVEWLKKMYKKGYTAADIVVIEIKNLTAEKARKLEKEYIEDCDPTFNVAKGLGSLYDPELVSKAKELRQRGMPFNTIATEIGKTTMTAWRYCQ